MVAENRAVKKGDFGGNQPVTSLAIYRTEAELTMPRTKPRTLSISLSYRLIWIGKRIVGRKRLLRWCLNSSWLLRRFAFELGSEVFGGSFQSDARALSEDVLQKWIPQGGSVIDIGCGPGRWCRIAARYANRVVGIDQSEVEIELARQASSEQNIEYIVGDVTRDLTDSRFDVAILVHVIEHIEDVDYLLKAITRIASLAIFEVPDFESDPLNMARLALGCPFYSDGDHVREYSLPMLREQLERNGWRIQHEDRRHGAILAVARYEASAAS